MDNTKVFKMSAEDQANISELKSLIGQIDQKLNAGAADDKKAAKSMKSRKAYKDEEGKEEEEEEKKQGVEKAEDEEEKEEKVEKDTTEVDDKGMTDWPDDADDRIYDLPDEEKENMEEIAKTLSRMNSRLSKMGGSAELAKVMRELGRISKNMDVLAKNINIVAKATGVVQEVESHVTKTVKEDSPKRRPIEMRDSDEVIKALTGALQQETRKSAVTPFGQTTDTTSGFDARNDLRVKKSLRDGLLGTFGQPRDGSEKE